MQLLVCLPLTLNTSCRGGSWLAVTTSFDHNNANCLQASLDIPDLHHLFIACMCVCNVHLGLFVLGVPSVCGYGIPHSVCLEWWDCVTNKMPRAN